MAKKVELHNAYSWDCDECGRGNFVRAVVVAMTDEDASEMMQRYGGDPEDWQNGQWMTRPDEVVCENCKARFETEEPPGPDDEAE